MALGGACLLALCVWRLSHDEGTADAPLVIGWCRCNGRLGAPAKA
jgi:hypothetical protein